MTKCLLLEFPMKKSSVSMNERYESYCCFVTISLAFSLSCCFAFCRDFVLFSSLSLSMIMRSSMRMNN